MAALPMAFIGAVAALVITGQSLTIAAMVGFIALVGVASRNGILLLNHYLHLVKYEGEGWTKDMIVRGGLERLAPVLMTALWKRNLASGCHGDRRWADQLHAA
jgi:HME family heavy-metal exporter